MIKCFKHAVIEYKEPENRLFMLHMDRLFVLLLSTKSKENDTHIPHKVSLLYNFITLLYNVCVISNYDNVSHYFQSI
ncbi:hypothetical protein KDA_61970 [Dictyobacter alpinus]|uniref:Uncharacterized protein n=1 Tax=Dictyobacter alpinus TaxID=2014873 RepID=A0A402BH59_9CHLR|nr:hypothetical protein KDA_61970 [Dictyobacter alpinus]